MTRRFDARLGRIEKAAAVTRRPPPLFSRAVQRALLSHPLLCALQCDLDELTIPAAFPGGGPLVRNPQGRLDRPGGEGPTPPSPDPNDAAIRKYVALMSDFMGGDPGALDAAYEVAKTCRWDPRYLASCAEVHRVYSGPTPAEQPR